MKTAAGRRPPSHFGGGEPASARRRPGRGGRGSGRGGLLGRHGGRRRPRCGSGLFLRRGGLPGHGACTRRLQFDENRVRHEALALRITISRSHHADRHGLRLVARQREAHTELAGRYRLRAGGSADLAQRCLGFGTRRLGLELHGGCRGHRFQEGRRIKLHPARHARASGKTECAGCYRDDSLHGQHSLVRPSGRVTPTQGGRWAKRATGSVPPHRVPPP